MRDNSILNTAAKRGLSRREFIQAALALGMSVPVASLLWTRTARAEAKAGGHLRLGLAGGATTDSLDPSTYTDTVMAMIGYTVRGNLIEVAADGSAVPEIAESFEGADAAKTWVFKLRRGIEFDTGKTVTVEDIISSIDHHRKEQSTSGAKVLLEPVEEIKADGKDTVIFTLREGNADFPYILADYHLNIMPYADGVPDLQAGAGPYRLTDFQAGVRATFERNPNSYKKAWLDSAELLAISDTTARQNGLVTGELDLINRPDLKTAHLLAKSPGLRIEDAPSRVHYNIPANAGLEPFTDVDVRLALKFAIDREAIVKTILFGHGQAGNDQPITPAYRYFAQDLKPRPYDPERGRFHLKKAGLESLTIELSAADAAFAGAVDAAVLYSEQAAAAGITIKVVRESNDGYWDQVWLKKPFVMAYWGGRPTEDVMFTIAYASGAVWNDTFWGNERLDKLLIAARAELDDPKRRAMYEEMQHIVSDEGSAIIPVFANNVHAMASKVSHADNLSGVWELDGARCIERWWIA